jgi:polar amino acid transport system substrate-binding protein
VHGIRALVVERVQEDLVRIRHAHAAVVLAAVAMLALSGCADNEEDEGGAPEGGTVDINAVQKDDALAAMVPDNIKSDGKLVVGTDPTYEPNEFKDASGKIVGFEIDLGTAIGKKLGLTTEFQQSTFPTILPALGTRYEIGISSFTDNKEREQTVDFVTYFSAGTAWASKDKSFDIDDACGKKVAVQTGTVQDTDDLPARQDKCKAAGKPEIQVQRYDDQAEATQAVVLDKADAVLADSPVMAGAVKKTEGQLSLVGETYDTAPYGIAIPKDAGTLKDAILGAVKALVDDGTYKAILDTWGVGIGAITDPVINGAQA